MKRTTQELIKELRLFNHHEAAAKMESLAAEVRAAYEALQRATDGVGFGKLAFPVKDDTDPG